VLAVALALSASLCWGVADFAGGTFSRRMPALVVVLLLEAGGLLACVLVLAATREAPPDPSSLLLAGAAGLSGTAGLVFFFQGMALGAMAVVAPVFASGAAIIPAVVGLATGDTVTTLVGAGIALAAIGILLASLEGGHEAAARRTGRAVTFALIGALGAAGFVVASDAAADGSILWTVLVARAAAVPFLAAAAVALRTGRPDRRDIGLLFGVGLIDLLATTLFALANTQGALAVVAVLGAMYPVVTAGLARGVLKERIRAVQLVGGRARAERGGAGGRGVATRATTLGGVLAHAGSGALVPLQLLPATVGGVLYALRVQALRGTPRAVPGWRQGCFYAGLLVIVAALASPLGHVAEELFLAT
jgi:drug/metabolite transporter (DMT)-like permease